jgi:tetratricopeptide (TPR) repeat protein
MDSYAQGLQLSAAGRHAQAIEAFERALVQRPDDTRTLFALGNTARALGMAGPAEQFFRRVLALEPARLEVIVNLANLLRSTGQFAAALALLEPALTRNPEAPELWLTLGSCRREMGEAEKAAVCYREALARREDYAAALSNLADLLADDGKEDEALALYDRALRLEPDAAQVRLNRAILHLLRGELADGWRDYAARLKIPGKAPLPDHKLARWNGSLKRTRLLVTAEQGVGDQIMFASLMPELAARASSEGGSIVLECEPRLAALFARSFLGVTVRSWEIEKREGVVRTHYGWLKALGGANAATEMGTLPRFLRKSIAAFAAPHVYLSPDEEETSRWQAAFAALPRPLTGLCWRSGSAGGARAVQYAPLEHWADFIRALPGTAISAQYDATPEEIAVLKTLSGRDIVVPQGIDQKQELDRAAALFSCCDAMVSAPTAASWLAAAVGVSTYKVLYDTSWTAFGTAYESFAPAARCLMPQQRGDWADVFAKALAAINQQPV